jgi:hypothetical protein
VAISGSTMVSGTVIGSVAGSLGGGLTTETRNGTTTEWRDNTATQSQLTITDADVTGLAIVVTTR